MYHLRHVKESKAIPRIKPLLLSQLASSWGRAYINNCFRFLSYTLRFHEKYLTTKLNQSRRARALVLALKNKIHSSWQPLKAWKAEYSRPFPCHVHITCLVLEATRTISESISEREEDPGVCSAHSEFRGSKLGSWLSKHGWKGDSFVLGSLGLLKKCSSATSGLHTGSSTRNAIHKNTSEILLENLFMPAMLVKVFEV